MKKKLMCIAATGLSLLNLSGCSSDLVKSVETAGLNTLLGMGTVFVVLIFISFVIWLIGYIPKMMSGKKEPQTAEPKSVSPPPPAPVMEEEEEDLTDDLELVAVITAAITASMEGETAEVPADGLVVRSIKKRNTKNWKNA